MLKCNNLHMGQSDRGKYRTCQVCLVLGRGLILEWYGGGGVQVMRRRSARGLLRAAVVAVVTLNIFFAFYVGTYLKSGVAHKAATEDNVPRWAP